MLLKRYGLPSRIYTLLKLIFTTKKVKLYFFLFLVNTWNSYGTLINQKKRKKKKLIDE